jgi:hypothetical protein
MDKRISRTPVLAAAVVLVLALASVALAAKPTTGLFAGKDFNVSVDGGKIWNISGRFGSKCTKLLIDVPKKIDVDKKGRFHFNGAVRNVTTKPAGKLTVNGKFKTTQTAVGRFKYVNGGCTVKRNFTLQHTR